MRDGVLFGIGVQLGAFGLWVAILVGIVVLLLLWGTLAAALPALYGYLQYRFEGIRCGEKYSHSTDVCQLPRHHLDRTHAGRWLQKENGTWWRSRWHETYGASISFGEFRGLEKPRD